jgi:hypothetical protein
MSDDKAVAAAYDRLRKAVEELHALEVQNGRKLDEIQKHLGISPPPDEPRRHLKALGLIPIPVAVSKIASSGHAAALTAAGAAVAVITVGSVYASNVVSLNPNQPAPSGIPSIAPGVSLPLVPSTRATPGRSAAPAKKKAPSSSPPSQGPSASAAPALPSPPPEGVSPPAASPGPPSFGQAPVAGGPSPGPSGGGTTGLASVPSPQPDTPAPPPPESPPPLPPPNPQPSTQPGLRVGLSIRLCLAVVTIRACIP